MAGIVMRCVYCNAAQIMKFDFHYATHVYYPDMLLCMSDYQVHLTQNMIYVLRHYMRFYGGSVNSLISEQPEALHILQSNPDKICWDGLSANTAACEWLETNIDKIYWSMLSKNPAAIHLLKQYPDKIDCVWLRFNSAAADLLAERGLDMAPRTSDTLPSGRELLLRTVCRATAHIHSI
jgi:hypothetical protein